MKTAVATKAGTHCGRFGEASGRYWESRPAPACTSFSACIGQLSDVGRQWLRACSMKHAGGKTSAKMPRTALKNKRSSLFLQPLKMRQLFLAGSRLFHSQTVFCSAE
ncbi:hypothetical protein [Delftia sp. HK171]|uniref:hypothetical protein n=1 Tax=Delftia sp. HK171 TaxID=1920191 RepID=UPI001150EAD8|nr:hypothetical protein [Delftia sp. HK171]